MNQITKALNGLELTVIERDDDDFCLSAEQAAQALGYADTAGFHRLMKRNAKLIAPFKGVVKLTTPGGMQDVTVIAEQGLYLLAMKAGTEKAEGFQLEFSGLLKEIRKGRYSPAPILTRDDKIDLILGHLTERSDAVKALAAGAQAAADEALALTADHSARIAAMEHERVERLQVNEILGQIKDLGEKAVKVRKAMSWSRFYRDCQRHAGVASLKTADKISLAHAELALEKARDLAGIPTVGTNDQWNRSLKEIALRHPPTYGLLSAARLVSVGDIDCVVSFENKDIAAAVFGNPKRVQLIEGALEYTFGRPLRLQNGEAV